MIYVEMGKKNIIDRLKRNLHGENIPATATSEIKEKTFPVTEFNHYTCTGL